MSVQLKNYRTDTGEHVSLVDDHGRKYLRILTMESTGLKLRKVPKDHERYLRNVVQVRKIPAMATTVRRFHKFGRRMGGLTKSTKRFLRTAMGSHQ